MNSIEEAAEAIADEMELPELHEQQHSIVHQPQQVRKGCWEVLQPNNIIFQNEVSSLGRRLRISVISKATDRMSNDVERRRNPEGRSHWPYISTTCRSL